ncbi:TPA: protease SohB [Escherichia coli]
MELLSEYGLFLAKIVTVVLAIAAIAAIIVNVAQRNKRQRGELRVNNLSEQYKEMKEELAAALMDSHQQKQWHKAQKKKHKQEAKAAKAKAKLGEVATDSKPRVWVLDFKGSMDAHEVNSLREEITAVLAAFKPQDQVVLRLESPGGMHGYGLAASQLQRLRDKNIPLTVTVDKVAASGGYMMACVADKIVSAPFAIVGSIGVVVQMPNFNRFLKSKDIDIELHTAGQYKRTLTLLGENTEEGREKFREELNETHQLFKDFVKRMRPSLDIEQVATGEHWYGQQAVEKGLVDEINTSDEVILSLMEGREVVNVRYMQRKRLIDRFTGSAAESADRLLLRWWQRGQKPLM